MRSRRPTSRVKDKAKKFPAKAPRRAGAQKGATESGSNKKAEVIAMMKRAKGATLPEIIAATNWQKHTVRGFQPRRVPQRRFRFAVFLR